MHPPPKLLSCYSWAESFASRAPSKLACLHLLWPRTDFFSSCIYMNAARRDLPKRTFHISTSYMALAIHFKVQRVMLPGWVWWMWIKPIHIKSVLSALSCHLLGEKVRQIRTLLEVKNPSITSRFLPPEEILHHYISAHLKRRCGWDRLYSAQLELPFCQFFRSFLLSPWPQWTFRIVCLRSSLKFCPLILESSFN